MPGAQEEVQKKSQNGQAKHDEKGCCEEGENSVYASRYMSQPLPMDRLAKEGVPRDAAYQVVHDIVEVDRKPRLNLASFVTTWMEPECDKLLVESFNKNQVDLDVYPGSGDIHDRCVDIMAHLFNAPLKKGQRATGTGTVGSSEGLLLGCLAAKRRWQNRRKAEGRSVDKPNMVAGSNCHVVVEKFARYFDVELRTVDITLETPIINPVKAVEMCDEHTICIVSIMGTTYTGHFEDMQALNDLLEKKNKENGWNVGIHVDAASGGFVAPFLHPELVWDFRLPWVKSINASGHKYGLCYPGTGWVVFREAEDLPEDLMFHVDYLGADQATFTLNFSKGAGGSIAQYYQFVRLGFEGYRTIMENCEIEAKYLAKKIAEMGHFEIFSSGDKGLPLVAFKLKDPSRYTEYDVSNAIRQYGWVVPSYKMPPSCDEVVIMRVVVREDFSRNMADWFIRDLQKTVDELEKHPKLLTQKAAEELEKGEPGEAVERLVEHSKKLREAQSDESGDGQLDGQESGKKKGHLVRKENPVC